MTLKFRPHHFLCTLGFQGRGYNDAFVANYVAIKDSLTDDTLIEVAPHTDSICTPCPHARDLLCATQEKITGLDNRHHAAMGFTPGLQLTWGEAKEKMKKLTVQEFHTACEGCSWKALGVCEKALIELKKS
jgi:hypothetical protein